MSPRKELFWWVIAIVGLAISEVFYFGLSGNLMYVEPFSFWSSFLGWAVFSFLGLTYATRGGENEKSRFKRGYGHFMTFSFVAFVTVIALGKTTLGKLLMESAFGGYYAGAELFIIIHFFIRFKKLLTLRQSNDGKEEGDFPSDDAPFYPL